MIEGKLAVLFGGGGFLGRHVAERLLQAGARVRIAQRNPSAALGVRPLGRLGQTQLMAASVTHAPSVTQAVRGADIVVNLVGVFGETMESVHVDGARIVAEAAAREGCEALVHISAIGADSESAAQYGRTKARGEAAVMAAFPRATILRPSVVFGQDDQFTNRFAGLIRALPVVPVIGADTRLQPVYVRDVAKAVCVAAADPARHGGKTFELGGPQVLSMMELNRWIARAIARERHFVEVPGAAAMALAATTGWLPGAPITLDQYRMLERDNKVAESALALADLGVTATPLAAVADDWLTPYRKHGRFGPVAAR